MKHCQALYAKAEIFLYKIYLPGKHLFSINFLKQLTTLAFQQADEVQLSHLCVVDVFCYFVTACSNVFILKGGQMLQMHLGVSELKLV